MPVLADRSWRRARGGVERLLALIAVIAGALAAAPQAQAAVTRANGKIAFLRVPPNENYEIHTVNADGTGLKRLTDNSAFSADSSYDSRPIWSPDGRKILFTAHHDMPGEVWTMNPDGSGKTNLTNSPTEEEEVAGWSPDGTKIVLTRCPLVGFCGISTMNADGGGLKDLVDGAFGPVWSPDGSRIAFERPGPPGTYTPDLYVMDPDGSDQQKVTEDVTQVVWAPGARLTFSRWVDNQAQYEVFTVEPDGSDERRLTFNPGSDFPLEWSPDGSRLLISRQQGSTRGLFTVDASGTVGPMIAPDAAADGTWSPDGTAVVALVLDDPAGLSIFDAVEGGRFRLPSTPYENADYAPDWQPLVRSSFPNAAAFCRAEREAAGEVAFDDKYGQAGAKKQGKNAFQRCVKQNR